MSTACARGSGGLPLAAPRALERQPPGMGCNQLVNRVGSPRSRCIRPHRRWILQQWLGAFPQALNAFCSGEQRVVVTHGIEDQPLVRLENVAEPVSFLRRE